MSPGGKTRAQILKNLPQSLEAEKSFLGSILLNNEVMTEIGDALKEDDFSLDAHRKIYMTMREMSEKRVPVDSVTLADALNKKDGAD